MITLDANSLVKLAITEEHSKSVYKIITSETQKERPIFAPDIILAEALNAIWVNFAVKKKIDERQMDEAFSILMTIFDSIEIIPTKTLAPLAMDISKKQRLGFYDSLYAAASLTNNAPLLTFDKEILSKAKELGVSLVDYK
jgi:predicted nucleic acid-binding protein